MCNKAMSLERQYHINLRGDNKSFDEAHLSQLFGARLRLRGKRTVIELRYVT